MAYEIADFTGTVLPVSGTNPYGYPVDAPSGTVVDTVMVADALVFFQKLMDEGGITPNGLPDNTTNTFQLWLAFVALVYGNWTNTGVTFENDVPGFNVWDNTGTPYGKFHYLLQSNKVTLSGVMHNSSGGSPATALVMTLPAAVRPTYTVTVEVWDSLLGATVQCDINTDGTVCPLTGGAGGTDIFFEGVTYKIGANTY